MITTGLHVYTRRDWGARYDNGDGPARVPWDETWLHHDAGDPLPVDATLAQEFARMRHLEAVGEQKFGRGISYSWVIFPSGRVHEGHGLDRLGAHTGGRNGISRAICCQGNYDVHQPSTPMADAIVALLRRNHEAGYSKRLPLTGGHRDVKATACPGRHLYARIPLINAAVFSPAPSAPPNPTEDTVIITHISDKVPAGRAAILSGSTVIDITGDAGARASAQAAINRGALAEVKVSATTWQSITGSAA
ncbi:MAG TPA: peptidoglycan recognition family protein [Pseudonocardiaceae bacterium]